MTKKQKAITRGTLLGGASFLYLALTATLIGHEWHFTGYDAIPTYFCWPLAGFLCFWLCGGPDLLD